MVKIAFSYISATFSHKSIDFKQRVSLISEEDVGFFSVKTRQPTCRQWIKKHYLELLFQDLLESIYHRLTKLYKQVSCIIYKCNKR